MSRSKLRYVSTDDEGYTRKPWGRGFTYLDADGKTIKDQALRDWIESIAIPPAWTDVWISPHQNGHILATGRDDKNRKQYCYHPQWQKMQNLNKFDQLAEFGTHLPTIRQVTDEHLRQRKVSQERVLAGIVRLLESTLIRVGNIEYAKQHDSYGLTTLTQDHAAVSSEKIVFDFVGKSGKDHNIVLRDSRLARIVRRCQDIPGQALFQYYDDDGNVQSVDSGDVNDYLQQITDQDFTAKIFRTWGGSTLAIRYLCENSDTDDKINDCIEHVASRLGNTKAVCQKYYIHPQIFDALEHDKLHSIFNSTKPPVSDNHLNREEATLIKLIQQSPL